MKIMTNLKNIFFTTVALLAFAACSSDDGEQTDGRIPIKLTSSNAEMDVVTRSAQNLQNDKFKVNEQLDVLITSKDGNTTYDPQVYKVNSLQGQLVQWRRCRCPCHLSQRLYQCHPVHGAGNADRRRLLHE